MRLGRRRTVQTKQCHRRLRRAWLGSLLTAITIALLLVASAPVKAAKNDHADSDFYEAKVRPVLVEHCYACHSAQAKKLKGGLLLDSPEGMRKGGRDRPGRSFPGKPDESLLIQAVRYDDELTRMPPKGKLPAAAIAALEAWVKSGAAVPAARSGSDGVPDPALAGIDFTAARKHWAYQPIARREPRPVAKNRLAQVARRRLRPGQARSRWPDAVAAGRSPHPASPGLLRPDRPASLGRGDRGVRARYLATTPSPAWSIACSPRRATASGGAGTGLTSPGTPTPRMACSCTATTGFALTPTPIATT